MNIIIIFVLSTYQTTWKRIIFRILFYYFTILYGDTNISCSNSSLSISLSRMFSNKNNIFFVIVS